MPKPPPLLPIPFLCRTKKRKTIITILFFPFFLTGCLPYLYHLGKEQSAIILGREKIETVLTKPNLDPKTKQKLNLIREVRKFAIDKLALNENGGFEYFTELNREEIGWNVSASESLNLKSYTWWFPIAGTVPYKGFFNKELAIELENELKEKGYDTRVRAIGGYSTLGWFSDPVLSPQLTWPDHRLVGLVIHEMAHATAYLPGDTTLNESYASFVEEVGTEMFYIAKEGENSQHLIKFKKEKLKREVILKRLKEYADLLKSVYESDKEDSLKLELKRSIILDFKNKIISENLIPEEKSKEFLTREWNNEDFLGALRYHSGEVSFLNLYEKSNRDLFKFHKEVQNLFLMPEETRKEFLNKSN
ncbi:aminopeptidase [Leptospira jelokensis]|uniref:aminopeptidase n=1 Tax=Leptospira jelokensis TaxID=2484931 RepID=UPI00109121E1|nr:aminopeptidase [Leptospira jelokensis]TGM01260.1 aminopeptidase [Leptospira jelokensis]